MSVNIYSTNSPEIFKNFNYNPNTNSYNIFNNVNTTGQLSADTFDYSKNDGKISLKDKLKNFAKGIISPITNMFKSPKNFAIGAGTIALVSALTVATGGAIAPFLVAAGVIGGGIQVGVSAYKAHIAKTDDEAKQAWQGIGAGTAAVVGSVAGAKAAAKGGGIQGAEKMNPLQATLECIKNAPKAISKSFKAFTSGEFITNLGLKKPAVKQDEVKTDAKTEAEPKAETTAEPKAEVKPKTEAEPKAETTAEPKAEVKPKTEAEPKAKTTAEPKAEVKPKTEAEPKAKTTAEPKAEVKPKTEAEPKAETTAEPKAEVKPKTEAEPKAETTAEPKAEVKPKTEAEPKAKTTAEQKAEVKTLSPMDDKIKSLRMKIWESKPRNQEELLAILKENGITEKEFNNYILENFKKIDLTDDSYGKINQSLYDYVFGEIDSVDVTPETTFYHGTTKNAAEAIMKDGFDLSKGIHFESGRGIYTVTKRPNSNYGYGDGTCIGMKLKNNAKFAKLQGGITSKINDASIAFQNSDYRISGLRDELVKNVILQQFKDMGYAGVQTATQNAKVPYTVIWDPSAVEFTEVFNCK